MNYFLRTQSDLLEELEIRMRSTDNDRWSTAEMYVAINATIRRWAQRVRVPFLYTISGGWSGTSFTLSLPDYIDPRFIRPQISTEANDANVEIDSDYETYVDIPGYWVEPSTSGNVLRLNTIPYTADGRILFWAAPGHIPSSPGTVAADSTTSMTVTLTDMRLPLCGYIKVNSEWIQYAGMTTSGTVATLSNLIRGVNGTTTATQSNGDNVDWGVPVDRLDLYEQMMAQSSAVLYQMFLTDAAPAERDKFQWNMRYAQQQADEYWASYSSGYEPQLRITTRGMLTGLEA